MEIFPVVDDGGKVIGEATRDKCHSGSFLLHPVVHCVIINSKGEWLLQLRSMDKSIQPGKWDTSVGGHVQAGESVQNALLREIEEEVGIKVEIDRCEYLHEYSMRSAVEAEYVYSYRMTCDEGFVKQDSEIAELKFFSIDEIREKIGSGVFTPNFEDEFSRVVSSNP